MTEQNREFIEKILIEIVKNSKTPMMPEYKKEWAEEKVSLAIAIAENLDEKLQPKDLNHEQTIGNFYIFQYKIGRDAWARGQAFKDGEHNAWKQGWQDACHESMSMNPLVY